MKQEKKFLSQEQQTTQASLEARHTPAEFASPEEMLRFDAKSTLVPGGLEARLCRSMQGEAPGPKPWWKRWFE